MTGAHPDLGPELRQLAQTILDRLDPAVRFAAARAMAANGPGQCQQLWCPVCALAALVNGEQHPLLTVIAEHSVALLAVVRAMVGESPDPPAPGFSGGPASQEGQGAPSPDTSPDGPGRYQHIPVTLTDSDE